MNGIFSNMNRFLIKATYGVVTTVACACSAKLFIERNNMLTVLSQDTVAKADLSDTSEDQYDKMTLKQVQVFFRHGARTPLHLIPKQEEANYNEKLVLYKIPFTDFELDLVDLKTGGPRENSKYDAYYQTKGLLKGGCHLGQLTSCGQYQTYLLGRQLRKDYIEKEFIEDDYDPHVIHVRSTNVARTIESLRCVMAGLFGRENLQRKAPIRIGVSTADEDVLIPNVHNCPVLRQINHAALIHAGDHPEFLEDRLAVEKTLGIDSANGDNKLNFINARDDIIARKTHGLPVPEPCRKEWERINNHAAKILYYAFTGQHKAEEMVAMRLSGGGMLDLVLENFDTVQTDKSYKKMCLYSAHDSSLVALIAPLGIYNNQWPPFAADLRFELYENEAKEQFVLVKYLGKPQIVRGCKTELCPLFKFKAAMKPYSIKFQERNEICNSDILQQLAKELLVDEEGEVETEEVKQTSDTPAGM